MPRKNDSQMIKDALQAKDIDILKSGLIDLTTLVKDGFKGVHERQDTANGRTTKNEEKITDLKFKFNYNRIIWYLFTTAVAIIIALGSYIIYHLPTIK